ncbi:MAG: major capsid protein [Kluyvera sp.]|uniref:major capsid protein n=1 Tax=Kluyvera sp. TaxID=1538228 RepID=UPI003A8B0F97
MEIIDLLRKCFGLQAVAVLLGNRKNLPSPVRSQFFMDGGQYPLASIPIAELRSVISNIPVVRRGTTAYALDRGKDSLISIEPQGIDMSDFITAAMLNNLKVLSSGGVQEYANGIMNYMMNTAQRTTEALCAQALTGFISYPMKADGGQLDTYEIDYGTPASVPDVDLSSATTVMDFYNVLDSMYQTLQDAGYGDTMTVAAGKSAFSTALALADNSRSNILQVKIVNQGEVNIGGYTIKLQSGKYRDINGQMVSKIPDNALCAADPSAGANVKYLALDDIANGLQPSPFATNTDIKNNPSGLEIVGRSKPLPIVATSAICWAKVLPDTVTTLQSGRRKTVKAEQQTSMSDKLNQYRVSFSQPATDNGTDTDMTE